MRYRVRFINRKYNNIIPDDLTSFDVNHLDVDAMSPEMAIAVAANLWAKLTDKWGNGDLPFIHAMENGVDVLDVFEMDLVPPAVPEYKLGRCAIKN